MAVLTLKLNVVQVLALSALGVAAGIWIKDRVPLLDRLRIPASVVGGIVYALLALGLRDRYLNLEMDLVLRDLLMVAFFTTIGLGASASLFRKGGVQVGVFLVITSVAAVLQNVLGIGLATLWHLPPLLGIATGSLSLTGGPATSLAFGPMFEQLGFPTASTVGLASAMFGIAISGLVAGHIGDGQIQRFHLRPAGAGAPSLDQIVYGGEVSTPEATPLSPPSQTEHARLLTHVIAIAVAMGAGTVISQVFERAGLTLPATVGAMLAGTILRNVDDRWRLLRLSQHEIDHIGSVALSLFIVMALLTLQLWQLMSLAGPILAILLAQVGLVWLLCAAVFRLMGRDYDAALIATGFCGFMLGTTANSMACMQVLAEKYGPAPRAYIVVALVGAFFLDFANALIISTMANLVR